MPEADEPNRRKEYLTGLAGPAVTRQNQTKICQDISHRSPHLLDRWRGEWRAKGDLAFPRLGRRGASLPAMDDARHIAELERKIGQLTIENDFLKKPCSISGIIIRQPLSWRECLFEEIEQAAAKGEAVNALCQMTGLNRAGFYRSRLPRRATPVEMEIRDEMQKIAVESAASGYRRITVELQRRGFDINHKRVLRMVREDNLLSLCSHLPRISASGIGAHSGPNGSTFSALSEWRYFG